MTDATKRLEKLTQFLAQDPDNTTLLADCLVAAHNVPDSDAVRNCQDRLLVASVSLGPKARYTLANSLLQSRRLDDCQALLAKPPEPGHEFVHAQLTASSAILAGEPAAALAALGSIDLDAIDDTNSRHGLSLLKAKALHHHGDLAGARSLLESLVDLSPEDRGARSAQLALLLLDMGDAEGARSALTYAAPQDPGTRITQAYLALGDGEDAGVTDLLAKVLQRDPDDQRALLGMGMLHMGRGEPAQAISYLQRCIRAHSGGLAARNALAWCQLSLKDIDEAENTWSEALTVDRTFSELHGGLAVVAVLRGNTEQYEAFRKRALGLDGGCFSAWFARFLHESSSGNEAAAERILTGLLNRDLGGKTLAQSLAARIGAVPNTPTDLRPH